jgi:predicted DCC family thiol-disulfide oxidoreductase YuxK
MDMKQENLMGERDDAQVPDPDEGRLTVYFDGSCPLCATELRYYTSRKGSEALRLIDVSGDGADPEPGLDRGDAMRRLHVRRPDGSLVSGAAAFASLWEALPGWSRVGRAARAWPLAPVLEVAYRAFLPIRPALSRLARRMGAKTGVPAAETAKPHQDPRR